MQELEKNLIESINKKFGKDTPMVKLSDEGEYGKPRGWIDTGIYALNWLISGKLDGGWPVGRISELDGDPSTGKSLLCYSAMKDPTLDLIVYFDTEAAMNIEFLKLLGVDYNKILYQPIDTIEQLIEILAELLDTIKHNKQNNKKILVVIDSIALASTEKELDPDKGTDMGYKAKLIRQFFRVYARQIEKYNISLLVTNHYTQKIGSLFGGKIATGGTGLKYASSVIVSLKVEEIDKIKKDQYSLGASAVILKARTEKNRMFSPKRSVFFVLDFDKGVSKYSGLFNILKDFGLIEKKGAWYKFPSWDSEKSFYQKDFEKIVEENNLLELIQNLIEKKIRNNPIVSEVDEEIINNLEGENEEKEL